MFNKLFSCLNTILGNLLAIVLHHNTIRDFSLFSVFCLLLMKKKKRENQTAMISSRSFLVINTIEGQSCLIVKWSLKKVVFIKSKNIYIDKSNVKTENRKETSSVINSWGYFTSFSVHWSFFSLKFQQLSKIQTDQDWKALNWLEIILTCSSVTGFLKSLSFLWNIQDCTILNERLKKIVFYKLPDETRHNTIRGNSPSPTPFKFVQICQNNEHSVIATSTLTDHFLCWHRIKRVAF